MAIKTATNNKELIKLSTEFISTEESFYINPTEKIAASSIDISITMMIMMVAGKYKSTKMLQVTEDKNVILVELVDSE